MSQDRVDEEAPPRGFRRALAIAAALNLTMMIVAVAGAFHANSLALFAEAVDLYEDAMTCLMAAALVGYAARVRAVSQAALAVMMLAPSLWIAWKALEQAQHGIPPEPLPMAAVGLMALGVNIVSAFLLAPHRRGDSTHRSVWIAARTDAFANVAIVAAAAVTAFTDALWPDALVAFGIAALNIHAAALIARLAWRDWRGGGRSEAAPG